MYRLLLGISFFLFTKIVIGQIDSLTQEELDEWKTELQDHYYNYDNFLINVLDRYADQNDRRISEVRAEYFFSPRATIVDVFPDSEEEAHNRESYIKRMANGVKKRHILSRQRKIIEISDFRYLPGTGIINNDLSTQYRRYQAEVFYHEKLFYSESVDKVDADPTFVNELHTIKKMKFVLRKNKDPLVGYYYELYCDGLDMVSKDSKEYEQQRNVLKEFESDLYEDLLANEKFHERKDLEIDSMSIEEKTEFEDRLIDSTFATDLKDTLHVDTPPNLNFSDYLFIGKGHFKAGKNGIRQVTGGLYMGGFLASCGLATYFKLKSNAAYADHLNANTIAEIDEHYDIANSNHHKYLYSVAAAGAIAIVSIIHLKIKSSRSNKRYKSILEQNEIIKNGNDKAMGLEINGFQDIDQTGLTLKYTF